MVETITIIILSAIVISGNFLNYLLNSRCTHIQCGKDCFIDRDVISEDKITHAKTELNNKEQL